jgi:putative tRNA adenosine deaminase-associated protein
MSGFVVAADLAEGDTGGASWRLRVLEKKIPDGLNPLLTALGRLRAAGVLLGVVCVEDDWCALVRPGPRGAQLLLSDASVVVEDDDEPGIDLARDILAELDVDGPTDEDIDDADDPDAPWPEGDFDILADLGVSDQVLSVILDDGNMLATEQLMRIAEELGFDDDLADILHGLGYTGWE